MKCIIDVHDMHGADGSRRGGNKGRGGSGSMEEEIYSIDSGWNENAFSVAAELLAEMEGWEVEAMKERVASRRKAKEQAVMEAGDIKLDHSSIDTEEWSVVGGGDDSFHAEDFLDDEEDAVVFELNDDGRVDDVHTDGDVTSAEIDLIESLPRHVLKRLIEAQEEAYEEEEKMDPNMKRKVAARRKTHRKLRIISGTAASVRIKSPQGELTRPMMEKVRGAVFSMIGSLYGTSGGLPEETRWLDLFAGTGAVGIEALSRGCGEGHFVELSDWVVENCLNPNLEVCKLSDKAVVHTMKAEEYLRRAANLPSKPFDFISVCPPYELVSYPEIYELLEGSQLIGETTIVLVEYPRKIAHQIQDTLGPLTKVRDRKYGRTLLALYAPEDAM